MADEKSTLPFRNVVLSLVQIGRDLTIIDDELRSLNATAVHNDSQVEGIARTARLAAQGMVREFQRVEDCARRNASESTED